MDIGSLEKVQATMKQPHDNVQDVARNLNEMAEYIQNLRKDITKIRPNDINDVHIPTATDELDAIVAMTETETGNIMEACETMEDILADMPEEKRDLMNAQITKIYEACSFQDITGQRISKVVSTFHQIEEKIHSLLESLGVDPADLEEMVSQEKSIDEMTDEDLKNGPQTPDAAMDQDDIDRLLNS